MPKRIPILAASDIAKAHDCRQVIVVAWDGERTHVVTYGANVEECDQAAQGGNRVKRALGWPESLCNDEPSRVKKLKAEIAALKEERNDAEEDYSDLIDLCKNLLKQFDAHIAANDRCASDDRCESSIELDLAIDAIRERVSPNPNKKD